ncbi:MAG: UDP-N-acetylmuramoyl-L-alanyl-D-glutamate--2,6-diaminopimelate ligase [Chloroflexi bacterium]|nr:UDP-N-acetylmuramoyl-L-alanyl-D-glutamate--2,6-diaminopimelate ligase [Chloroflexota bacterium]
MLADLLQDVTITTAYGDLSVEVTGIADDSRIVRPGEVFVACTGHTTDGRHFIADAIARGAAAIVCEPPAPSAAVPVVLVPNARRALAELSAAFYGHPSRHLGLIGVTGTDGKTTTTHLIAAILRAAGIPTGLITTVAINVGGGERQNQTLLTTPPAPVLQHSLAEMRTAGMSAAAVEVSSHALETWRVHGCVFDCAVFTNLDPEHLDFHGSLVAYRAAKAKLFAMLDQGPAKQWGRLAVVNADDPHSPAIRAACSVPAVSYGLGSTADYRAEIQRSTLDGTVFRVVGPPGEAVITTHLGGRHNVLNWLGAIAAAHHLGASLEDAHRAGLEFPGVPGRLEPVRCGQPFHVFVDFAHTPQALAATLEFLRPHVRGRLIVLFGQAGRRDRRNRARMAAAVASRADLAVVTSDDPYDEDPCAIVDDIGRALQELGWREEEKFWRIVDRRTAIAFAVELARAGDCVLLAGRGPEETTVIHGIRIPLVDADVAREVLESRPWVHAGAQSPRAR